MTLSSFAADFVGLVRNLYSTDKFVPLHAPRFLGSEQDNVIEAIQSTFVSTVGKQVEEFEQRISDYTGSKYTVATINGTAALHTALLCCGVGQGEEVITSPLTFVATCNAIKYCGADPIFIDVDQDTLGMSPDRLEEFLAENTEIRDDNLLWNQRTNRIIRACLPVHNLGHPVQIDKIKVICDRYNVLLIEDAAESLGSVYKGLHTGRVGRVGVVSFNGNKIVTTGGGGALITDDHRIAETAKHKTTTAKQPHPWLYIHDDVGYNYRLPNLNAALGCAQIDQLDDFVRSKRSLADQYRRWFVNKSVEFIVEPISAKSNYWLNAILLKDRTERDMFLQHTNDEGVMTRPMWTPMHTLPMYKNCQRNDLSTAESIEDRLVNIPSSVV